MRINRRFSRTFKWTEKSSLRQVTRAMLVPLAFGLASRGERNNARNAEARRSRPSTITRPRQSQWNCHALAGHRPTPPSLFLRWRAHCKRRGKTIRLSASRGWEESRSRSCATGRALSNPSVGYSGDEIRGGEVHGGKQGFFVEQTIVTGGKLSRAPRSDEQRRETRGN